MYTVLDLLHLKGHQVWTISPQATILEALQMMAAKNVGALVVAEHGDIKGIVSERDFARGVAEQGACNLETQVRVFMTPAVIAIGSDKSVDDCMVLMTRQHIRHLPVIEDGQMVGLISIGDVVNSLIQEKTSMITSLENYILGRGYAQ